MPKAFQVDTAGTLLTGLVSYYKLEDGTDFYGSNHLTGTAITYNSGNGKVNNGAGFASGTSSKLITNSFSSTGNTVFTLAGWFKSTDNSHPDLVRFFDNASSNGIELDFQTTTGKFEVVAYNGGTTNPRAISASAVNDGNWHLVILSSNGGNLRLRIDNGTAVTTSGSPNPSIGDSLCFGANGYGGAFYTGALDEWGVWIKLLSTQEETDLWNSGVAQTMVNTATTYTQSLPVTATASVLISKVKTAVRSLTITAASVLSLTKGLVILKALAVTASSVLGLAKARTVVATLPVTATASVSLTKSWTHLIHLVLGSGASNTAGPTSPGTGADDATVGTRTWSNPGNITSSNNSYATATSSGGGNSTTHYLKATNFGFSIPDGATIDGITVEIERKGTKTGGAGNWVKDSAVRIVKADGSFGSANKGDTSSEWPTSDAVVSYGSSSDPWSESWSAAAINDADFGAALSAVFQSPDAPQTASVDHVRITIDYTEAGGATAVVSITKGLVKSTTLSVTATAVLALSKTFTAVKSFSISAVAVVSLAKANVIGVVLSVTAQGVASLVKGLLSVRNLTVLATASVSLSKAASYFRTLSVTPLAFISLTKGFLSSKTLEVSAVAVASLARVITRVVNLSVTATARVKIFLDGLLSIFSKKYPSQSGSYTEKFPSNPASYSEKYPSRTGNYEEKYPS